MGDGIQNNIAQICNLCGKEHTSNFIKDGFLYLVCNVTLSGNITVPEFTLPSTTSELVEYCECWPEIIQ